MRIAARAARILGDREFGLALLLGQASSDAQADRERFERLYDALEKAEKA